MQISNGNIVNGVTYSKYGKFVLIIFDEYLASAGTTNLSLPSNINASKYTRGIIGNNDNSVIELGIMNRNITINGHSSPVGGLAGVIPIIIT